MVKVNNTENPADFSFCKEMFGEFGERQLIGRGEYFAHSGKRWNMPGGLFQVV